MKKEFTKLTGITDEMFKDYCKEHNLNWKDKEIEDQFVKDVYSNKIKIKDGKVM